MIEAVREIRVIEMFANESIMTVLMTITRIYRENNIKVRESCYEHTRPQIIYDLYICNNRICLFTEERVCNKSTTVNDF